MAEQSITNENAAQTAFMCQFCDQQNVKWKCVNCDIFLCTLCKDKIHQKLKSTVQHRILSIQDIGKNSNQAASLPTEEDIMSCPKCYQVYPDLDSLQIHVLDCIDN